MNFFEHQDRARRNSRRLVALFVLAVVAIIVVIYLVIVLGLRSGLPGHRLFDPELFFKVAGAVAAVIGIGALIKIAMLSAGGSAVAESVGGRLVSHSTKDPAERRLVNVVEEMAIASGVPVPQIYVLDHEEGINAFAAGYRPEDAAIAVTRGALENLSRDELQGVIGHEFSHILNGDMRLNIRLLGMLGGIMAIAIIGRMLMRSAMFSRKKEAAGVVMAGLLLIVIGYIGVLAGRIIQAAISRQREFLADASSVQFTRNPSGIAGALRRIKESVVGSRVAAPAADEAAHMFFGPISFARIFATHPPLDERIRRIEESGPALARMAPLRVVAAQPPTAQVAAPAGASHGLPGLGVASGFANVQPSATGAQPRLESSLFSRESALSSAVGTFSKEALDSSAALLGKLPKQIQESIRTSLGACAVTWALLLDHDDAKRQAQLELLQSDAGFIAAGETSLATATARQGHTLAVACLLIEAQRIFPYVRTLPPGLRLPLVDLAVPSLRTLSKDQFRTFQRGLELLIQADKEVTLFEFCLWTVIDRRVRAASSPSRHKHPKRLSSPDLRKHCCVLLSAVSHAGSTDPDAIAEAFQVGAASLAEVISPLSLLSKPESLSPPPLSNALAALADSPLATRRKLLDACSKIVLHDRAVTVEEAQLLRAIAYALDLPLPPFIEVV